MKKKYDITSTDSYGDVFLSFKTVSRYIVGVSKINMVMV